MRGDLGADAGERPALLDRDEAVGLLDRRDDGLDVERAQGAQIDHLGLDALLRQLLGGLAARACTMREKAVIVTCSPGARDPRLADRHDEIGVVRHREALAVEQLVLEEDHRVRVADRRFQQALVIGRRYRARRP